MEYVCYILILTHSFSSHSFYKVNYGLSKCALILHCHFLHFVAIRDHILIHTAAMILLTFDVSVLFHEPEVWHETGCQSHAL